MMDVRKSDIWDEDHHAKGNMKPASDGFMCYKISKQLVIIGVWVTMGLTILVFGPTIPDLRASLGYSYEEISRGLAARSAGSFVGSVLGGILNDICPQHSELILVIAIITGSICNIFIPFVSSLSTFVFLMVVIGVDFTIINTGGMPMVLDLWKDKASGPMHSTHFGFGLGAVLAPLIAEPFLLSGDYETEGQITMSSNTTIANLSDAGSPIFNISNGNSTYTPSNRIYYPYAITSGISIAIALVLLGFYIKGPPQGFPTRSPAKSLPKLINPASCIPGRPGYSTIILILLFVYYIHAPAGEHVYGTFIFSYSLERGVDFDKTKAAILTSVYWGSHVCGRFSGILISQFFKPRYVIIACLLISLACFVCLSSLSHTSQYVLWILSPVTGYVTSLFYASGILWAQQYIIVNAMATMIFLLGTSVGMLIYLYITGYMFDAHGLESFSYVLLFYIGCYIVVFIMMEVVVWRGGSSLPGVPQGDLSTKGDECSDDEEMIDFIPSNGKDVNKHTDSNDA